MKTYALILSAKVANKVRSENPISGVSGYDAVVEIQAGQRVEIGDGWNGAAFIPAPPDPLVVNRATIESDAPAALVQLRQYRDLAVPTAAQRLAFERVVARLLIGLVRIELNQFDGTT